MIIELVGFKNFIVLSNKTDRTIRYRFDGKEVTENSGFILSPNSAVSLSTPDYLSVTGSVTLEQSDLHFDDWWHEKHKNLLDNWYGEYESL